MGAFEKREFWHVPFRAKTCRAQDAGPPSLSSLV